MNLENCLDVKKMTALEAIRSMKLLSSKTTLPIGIGIWEGELTGKISGQTYSGEHIAVFQETALVCPFGPRGDAESEANSALFVAAVKYSGVISEKFESMLTALELAETYLEDGATATALDRVLSAISAAKA